ncbi:PREDICTED: charged multivesicular body protein 2b [Miniopterus natalensis]|uniref:charged multivesicular body protein 2b n=1 Tax=Miniopterus natalensis TaxID=291302 RepID=UPI0007A72574|nr:PREDICTED: charged multivesicular body protein 2b [Miniopterus natalensis]
MKKVAPHFLPPPRPPPRPEPGPRRPTRGSEPRPSATWTPWPRPAGGCAVGAEIAERVRAERGVDSRDSRRARTSAPAPRKVCFLLLSDVIKEQNRELRGTQRAISRDRAALEKQEKQLELEIKKMAKIGNKEACRVLAKQLVQLRKQKTRTFAVSSKVTSMSTQTKVMNSQMKMAGAMSTTAKTMQAVNKKVDPQKTLQTMQNFQKENMKMEMTEEMINDTLDDIFDGSDDEEESQDIVDQVLDEIGIEISGKMAKAPSAARSLPSASTSKATISDEEIERQLKALGVD